MKKRKLEYYVLIQFILVVSVVSIFLMLKLMGKLGLSGCAFLETTHLYCPGCGGTRSFEALLHFDIFSSFRYNAIVPIGIVLFLYYDIKALISIIKNDTRWFKSSKYIPIIIFALFVVIYFIIRNIFSLNGIDFMTMS